MPGWDQQMSIVEMVKIAGNIFYFLGNPFGSKFCLFLEDIRYTHLNTRSI